MSRQAVSKKMLSLEQRLGVKLFDRTTNVIELTAEGKLYLDFFRNMVQDFETLLETTRKLGAPASHLLIGYELGVIIDRRVVEIMSEYKREKSNVELKIRRYEPHTIENKLLSGELDMAFTSINKHSKIYKDFPHIIIEYAEYVLVASKNHPKVNKKTKLSDFNGEQTVYWNVDNIDDIIRRKNFSDEWSDIGVNVIPSIQCSSLSAAYTELLVGNAVMLCNAKNEFCTLPGIITYPLKKQELFGCVWNQNAPSEIKELAAAIECLADISL